jgi:hypothetical protein
MWYTTMILWTPPSHRPHSFSSVKFTTGGKSSPTVGMSPGHPISWCDPDPPQGMSPGQSVSGRLLRPLSQKGSVSTCDCKKLIWMPSVVIMSSICTVQGTKKTHDWVVEKIDVPQSGSQWGVETSRWWLGPVNLVMDLCLPHECFGSRSNPSLNGNLHYPVLVDIDKPVILDMMSNCEMNILEHSTWTIGYGIGLPVRVDHHDGYPVHYHRYTLCRYTNPSHSRITWDLHTPYGVGFDTVFGNDRHEPREFEIPCDRINQARDSFGVKITHSPITLANLSFVNFVSITLNLSFINFVWTQCICDM